MGFGPWDLARLVLGAGNVGRHVAKENRKRINHQINVSNHEKFIQKAIQDSLDPELEAKYREMINDPSRHDEVWGILERYWSSKSLDGKELFKRYHPEEVAFIEGGRRPLAKDHLGHTNEDVENNKKYVLIWLMRMHGKCPSFYAEKYFRDIFG